MTLTATANNIHQVKAIEPSQVIDVFTPPYNRTRVTGTRWYEIRKTPRASSSEDVVLARVK